MEMRIPEAIWHADDETTQGGLVEQLEAQVEALNRKVGRLERRQQRFADMVRLLLSLHDQTAARLAALDGGVDPDVADLTHLPSDTARLTETEALPRVARNRRTPVRRHDP